MSITSGFFDSVDHDRVYNAEQMSTYFDGLVSDGVYENVGDRFLVSPSSSNMSVSVGSGRAIIKCRWIKNDDTATLTLDPADATLNRIDAIVLRLDTSARSITLTVKKGTAVSGQPSLPAITRTETVHELYLASVLIQKGAASPTSVTDLRPSTYCGWVTGIIKQVDTADLFRQWQTAYDAQYAQFAAFIAEKEAAFNNWFANLTATLQVDLTVTKYQRVEILDRTQLAGSLFWVGIPEYNQDNDILLVYVNGVFYPEITDNPDDAVLLPYGGFIFDSLPTDPEAVVYFNRTLAKDDTIMFVVLKNIVGKSVINSGNAVMQANGYISRNIGIAEEV